MMARRNISLTILTILFILIDIVMILAIFTPEIFKEYADHRINYDFYIIIKWLTFIFLIPISIILYNLQYKKYTLIAAAAAILYNPFFIIHLYVRSLWILLDVLLIIVPIAIIVYERYIAKSPLIGHNPQDLVKALSNFTRDTPLKYTTHIWDFGSIKKEYGDFKGFMNNVENKWQEIEEELKKLSPKLHAKIYNFIFASQNMSENGWFTKDNITIGWSSLDGLEQWCNDEKDPFEFKLKEPYIVKEKHIDNFGEIINIFKREIEIRNENSMLESLFIKQKKKLGRKFKTELIKLKGKTFYTDVDSFNNALDKIFSEIKKREHFQVKAEATEEVNGKYVDIKIIQIDSYADRNSKDMLAEVENGDFQGIKESLTNLCDWSIESSYENENYRINYLRSDRSIDEIEILGQKPIGFTYILRFYYK